MRGKQSVRKGVWYLGGRKSLRKRTKEDRRGEGGATPFALIAFWFNSHNGICR